MQPHILIERLASYFYLPDQLLALLLNFLTNRTQQVLINGVLSKTLDANKDVSFFLYFLFYILTAVGALRQIAFLLNFQMTLLCCLQGTESDHGNALPDFVKRCDDRFLDLNVSKTKEVIIDFRKHKANATVSMIHREDAEIVESYKYLGTLFDSQLRFDINTDSVVKQAHHSSAAENKFLCGLQIYPVYCMLFVH